MKQVLWAPVLVACLGLSPRQDAAATPDFAAIVPDDCTFCVSVRDFDAADPAGVVGGLAKLGAGLPAADLFGLTQGELCVAGTLALEPHGLTVRVDRVLVLLDAGANADAVDEKLRAAAAAFTRTGGWFAIGDAELVKAAVDLARGTSKATLSAGASYAAVRRAVGENADVRAYVDVNGIAQALRRSMAADKDQQATFDDVLRTLGLDGAIAAGAGLTVAADRLTLKLHLLTPDGPRGLVRTLFPEGAPPRIPECIPATAAGFWNWRVDLPAMYEVLARAASAAYKASGESVDLDRIVEVSLGFNPRDEVFGNLTGEIGGAFLPEPVLLAPVKKEGPILEAIKSTWEMSYQGGRTNAAYETEKIDSVDVLTAGDFCVTAHAGYVIAGGRESVKRALKLVEAKAPEPLARAPFCRELVAELPEGSACFACATAQAMPGTPASGLVAGAAVGREGVTLTVIVKLTPR